MRIQKAPMRLRAIIVIAILGVALLDPEAGRAQMTAAEATRLVDEIFSNIHRKEMAVVGYQRLPISVSVAANDIGLTQERLRTRLELKLRSLGISPIAYDLKMDTYLSVGIRTVGPAFLVTLEFHRRAEWELPSGEIVSQLVAVYNDSMLGTSGRDANYILNSVDPLLEEFLNQYLKANQK